MIAILIFPDKELANFDEIGDRRDRPSVECGKPATTLGSLVFL